MQVTALTKFTTIDFPGKLACIVFTGGCNLRCGFCHNAEFVLPEKLKEMEKTFIPFEVIKNFLKSRKGMLEGVVICGGEPTVQPDLKERIVEIRAMGFAIKLDTNGSNPDILENLIKEGLLDYVAMDLKDIPEYRKELVGVTLKEGKIMRSIELIKNSGINYEFRTTVVPQFHSLEILQKMGETIKGAKKWALQGFRNFKTLNEIFGTFPAYNSNDLKNLATELSPYAEEIVVR